MDHDTFNVISAYAPQVRLAEHLKVMFWEDLKGLCYDIPLWEKILLEMDLNGHVENVLRGFEGLHDSMTFGRLMQKPEGNSIFVFS